MKKNQSALVTGASKRIGKAIALHLADIGFDIALHYRSADKAALETQKAIKKKGRTCKLFPADFKDAGQVRALFQDIRREFPELTVLINNASIFNPSSMKTPGYARLDDHFAINLRAPYILIKEFARHCKKGNIINILDTNIRSNRTAYVDYLVSKKTLAELTYIAAVDLAPGIRVNGIAPGLILPPSGKKGAHLDRMARRIPLKRKGKPEDIAEAVEYLLKADFVLGHILYVDGGEHLVKP